VLCVILLNDIFDDIYIYIYIYIIYDNFIHNHTHSHTSSVLSHTDITNAHTKSTDLEEAIEVVLRSLYFDVANKELVDLLEDNADDSSSSKSSLLSIVKTY